MYIIHGSFLYSKNKDNNDTGKTISGNGTTVVNVYYSRNLYEVEFNLDRTNGKLVIGGQTYTHPAKYSFKVKYMSDISNLWPTATNIANVSSYKFYGWTATGFSGTQVSKVLKLTSDYLSTSGKRTFNGNWEKNLGKYTLHYMIESLTGTGQKKFGSKWYNEDTTYSQTANATGEWNAKQLPGVTNVGKKSETGNHEYFFYDRNTYKLNFYNLTVLAKTKTLKFGTSIQNEIFTPARPAGISADYVFEGWFSNAAGQGNEFVFMGATMPENNLVLYAKWAPPKYSVKYYQTQDATGDLKSIDDISGGTVITVSQLSVLEPEGFKGWYWYLGESGQVFEPFDFNMPINSNGIVLYPVWDKATYTVSYEASGADGAVPDDHNDYLNGAAANVLAPDHLVAPEYKVFIGWKISGQSKIYYPNDKLTITGNMILTAQWGMIVPEANLTYKANGGLGLDRTVSLYNHGTHDVEENTYTQADHVL